MISILLLIGELLDFSNVLFFVGATDKLPEPLSREMEEYYLMLSNDGDLTASIVVVTTLMASVTLTAWIFILKSRGLIC